MSSSLRATVVVDYQNVHLVGHNLFDPRRPRHETLIDPGLYAMQLLSERNRRLRNRYPDSKDAVLRKVLVYRGEPSADHDPRDYARNHQQRAHWERDSRVQVTLRPLKYEYQRDASGRPATLPDGSKIVTGKREKGVDVLCALAVVREAADPATDLIILASTDSDLAPAVEEVLGMGPGATRVETTSWYDTRTRVDRALRGSGSRLGAWNTRLVDRHFVAARDTKTY